MRTNNKHAVLCSACGAQPLDLWLGAESGTAMVAEMHACGLHDDRVACCQGNSTVCCTLI